jgi:hypothetical protein
LRISQPLQLREPEERVWEAPPHRVLAEIHPNEARHAAHPGVQSGHQVIVVQVELLHGVIGLVCSNPI